MGECSPLKLHDPIPNRCVKYRLQTSYQEREQFVSFDLTIDNPVDIANHLWGHDKHQQYYHITFVIIKFFFNNLN